ncbi:DUF6493 family protein [Undibacterium sp. Ji50W]|uniref:DUF6493 family protein n=1 Tax=Undibacterium sp. Ji50W TaxID=3413041 RepID=UPI003BEFF2D7
MTKSSTANPAQSNNSLYDLIEAGDYDGTVAYLAELPPADRYKRRNDLLHIQIPYDEIELSRARDAALFLCGVTRDIVNAGSPWGWRFRLSPEDFVDLWRRFKPRATEDFAEELLKRNLVDSNANRCIAIVHALYLADLIPKPQTESYARTFAQSNVGSWADEDPKLLREPLLQAFEVEGGLIYDAESTHDHKQQFYLRLIREGIFSRSLLLEKTIGTLEKPWSQHHSGWFAHFHRVLEPTANEMQQFAERYLSLCHSRNTLTINVAVTALSTLYRHEMVSTNELMPAVGTVLSATTKGLIDSALKLLDQIVNKEPTLSKEAAALTIVALSHTAADVQKKVIDRLTAWGMTDATKDRVRALLPQVSAKYREQLATISGQGEKPAPPKANIDENIPSAQGPSSPLDETRRISAINDLAELVERTAYVLENNTDIDEFERVLDGLVRLVPSRLPDVRKQFLPVLKRAHKLKPDNPNYLYDKRVARAMARFILFLFDDEKVPLIASYCNPTDMPCVLLCRRIDDLMDFVTQKKTLSPLASPSHRRGFIDPEVLVHRIAAHIAADAQTSLFEQVLSLLRLAPGHNKNAQTTARELPETPYTQALRYALGDTVAVGKNKELFIAAGRARHPGTDDPDLIATYGDIGPDGAHAARYPLSSAPYNPIGSPTKWQLTVSPAPVRLPLEYISIARHQGIFYQGGQECLLGGSYWRLDEGLIKFSATLTPSCLDAFFAQATIALVRNIDWVNAEWCNSAFLSLLLDPAVPMNGLETITLALGLVGKEPGQSTLAVDALVATWQDGRLNVPALGKVFQQMLANLSFNARRLQKTLKAATQSHQTAPRMAFDLLCIALVQEPGDLNKEISSLLDFLLELAIELGLPLPPLTRSSIEQMQISGKGKAIQKDLLQHAVS